MRSASTKKRQTSNGHRLSSFGHLNPLSFCHPLLPYSFQEEAESGGRVDDSLQLRIQKELVETGAVEEDFSVLVSVACEGAELLEEVLGGQAPRLRSSRAEAPRSNPRAPTSPRFMVTRKPWRK